MAITYHGFSTINRSHKFKLNDFELAKLDLYNHLHIKKGEKVMNPEFGTIIWGLLFEPLDERVKQAMQEDITRIIAYDPRLAADTVTFTQQEHGLMLQLDLRYIPTNQTDKMMVSFDRGYQP